ncbi:kinase-like domain-containing protein [Amylostereum chailletii]|nr:kinase-like domain-containing protein [Amylostereum chailletii]
MDFYQQYAQDTSELIAETIVSVISRSYIQEPNGASRLVAIKAGSTKRKFVKEPHDISKELRLLLSLSHPAIIQVIGHDFDQRTSILRFWMPYLPHTLATLLACPLFSPRPHEGFPASAREAAATSFLPIAKAIIYQIASGVTYLHHTSRRIAHRDIKPSNILLDLDCTVKLIDFGVSYRDDEPEADKGGDVWPENNGKMYFEVGSGPYRAPELLFGPRSYDAIASDLWSMGTTFAEFFTTLHHRCLGDSDYGDDEEEDDPTQAYAFDQPGSEWSQLEWERYPLFDSSRGDIGLAWSIFKTRGSPTTEIWPTFTDLPDATKVNFVQAPVSHFSTRLPNLPNKDRESPDAPPSHMPPSHPRPSALDLIHRLLVYSPPSRLPAAAVLDHPWLSNILLPPRLATKAKVPTEHNGKKLADLLRAFLGAASKDERSRGGSAG